MFMVIDGVISMCWGYQEEDLPSFTIAVLVFNGMCW
jgi:hypothetical protein